MEFSVKASLSYRVPTTTPFVFNVHAQRTATQAIEHERFTVDPPMPLEHWTMPESGNRYVRLIAPAGGFKVSYHAAVRLHPRLEDPAEVREIDPGELPLSVLTHLYPSRYCQGDLIEPFVKRTFGKLERGYSRVLGICNWIGDKRRLRQRLV